MVRRDVLAAGRRLGLIALGLAVALLSASPARAQAPAATPAPNQRLFASDAAVWLHFIKADKAEDFEMVLAKLKEALTNSEKPERKQQLAGWKIFRSPDPAGANVLFVMVIDSPLKGADYSIGNIIAESFPPAEANKILTAYAGAYASPAMNIVNLNTNLGAPAK